METQAYLTFELNGLHYGLATTQVREVFQLPEVTPIADAPGDIIGILNFRGKILPIMHLAKRLGQDMPGCQLSDSVIVIEWQGLQVGMVVNQVDNVRSFHISSIEAAPSYEFRDHYQAAFAANVAKLDDEIIILLNPEALIRQTDDVAMMTWEAKLNTSDSDDDAYPSERVLEAQEIPVLTNFFSLYCPHSTPEEQQVFRQRAIDVRQSLETSDISSLMPLAVIGLGGEYFGVDLHRVREFINTRHVMSIPCCPSHIVGNMNLRGEVMTLIDIREELNLFQPEYVSSKAVVIEVDDIVAGITVDQVLDVIYLSPSEITAMPTVVSNRCQAFFQGATRYAQNTLSILDLSKLLSQGGLVVNQAM
ncbi:chemotaxis signal transduction protein [Leptolyngbya sp. Heron Island J]|uniref:chemotaxis protein CheW n=1 Tax=Leptolyngbya sp. Heron Island J TaxID=1385935 RepID=UPI0003B97D71|nr:chemotaxis protein CheW [Leptolyngbya sp. Heron Island J]ESA35671.1 chemotaxis signal transduction protein [Leptolyngbya sp. Heron Island J]